jgi:UDP-N-acetylmuramoyl-tripeptide--D-alanyl-D-alanine ligase
VRFLASEVALATGGRLVGPDVAVDGASFDSRSLRAGQLFVPIVAERDGHEFVGTALASGAPAYLTEREPLAGTTAVVVADTRAALLALGAAARRRVPGPVIGVTGSVGKTTVKDLIAGAMQAAMPTVASPKSFNNELGLPTTLLDAPDDTVAAVLEMGMRGFGHITLLCQIAPPTIGVITVIGSAHTEQVGGLAGVARAKGELVEALPASGTAVLNADQAEWLPGLQARTSASVLTFGVDDGDVRATRVRFDELARPTFELATPWGSAEITLLGSGTHLPLDGAAAAAAALAAGAPLDAVVRGLGAAVISPGRSDVVRLASGALLLDGSYNANPTSMTAAIETLAALPVGGRRVAVLGRMAELGEDSDAQHAAIGALVLQAGLELVAVDVDTYGVAGTHGIEGALDALGGLQPGDAVLVKASRAAGLDRLVNLLLA